MRFLIASLLSIPAVALAQPEPPTPTPEPPDAPAPPPAPIAHDTTTATAIAEPPITPTTPAPPVTLFPQPSAHRLVLELELFGDAAYESPSSGTSFDELRLDRAEVGAALRMSTHTGAELRLETVRSAAQGGTLGIDGDSLVVRIKRAQIYGDYESDQLRLDGALGMTPDAWIASLEDGYTLRPLSATGSERLLGWPTSDLAALGRVAYGPARLSISIGNGEGQRYPERNTGKTTTAVIEVVPLTTPRLRVAAMARDGSIGPALARDHRFGAAATITVPIASAGAELVRALGVGERGDVAAWLVAGWAEVRPWGPLVAAARVASAGYDAGSGRATTAGGALALAYLRTRVWIALDRTTTSGVAMPLPTDPGTVTTVQLIVSTTAPFAVD